MIRTINICLRSNQLSNFRSQTKDVTKSRKSMNDRQCNDQKKKRSKEQTIISKTLNKQLDV